VSEPIYDRVMAGLTRQFTGPPATMTPATTLRRPPVSLATDIQTATGDVKSFVEDHFGGLLDRAAKLEQNPILRALEDAALGPAGEALVVDFVGKLASFAQAVTPPAPAAAELTPDSTPDQVPDVPADPGAPTGWAAVAGPVVGGQA
jgi:hypothetical protein